ncbi:Poly(ADP-ribose) polymerase, catalytic domain-containing protein [Artemisia annua]|uniref:Poly(ADP-ribose) polymerase, catalytic domain-containing protein n=1 Tax=Artemisia annua TaxID=35608 RepID=A0A2U1NFE6_ARTAN|nr:Poly(ADP-ribose) polymerase, catalytic domain-containing protein [Artemisia annua]
MNYREILKNTHLLLYYLNIHLCITSVDWFSYSEASAQLKIEGSERAEDLTKMGNPSEIVKDDILYPSFSNPARIGSAKSLAEMMSRRQWEVLEELPNHMWKHVKLQFTAENEVCDQMFDDLVSPKKYIIWSSQMNTHILLEFVISFKTQRIVNRSQVNGVRLGKPISPWISIPDLIANLSKMLPSLGASIWEIMFRIRRKFGSVKYYFRCILYIEVGTEMKAKCIFVSSTSL